MLNNMHERNLEYPQYSDEWYIHQYLLHGSVEQVYCAHRWDIKISTASYHRLVKNYGIIKYTGRREASLTELLQFFAQKALAPTNGIETVYFKQMPSSFQTSLATIHRTYQNILNSNLTRSATGLIIHSFEDRNEILVGQEVSTKRRYGKYAGNFSIPLTFSQAGEDRSISILRVLQQEVLSDLAASGNLKTDSPVAQDLIGNAFPVLNFHILDVSVDLFEITLPYGFPFRHLNSPKLTNLQFCESSNLQNLGEFRTGVLEMVGSLNSEVKVVSDLNKLLLQVPV